MAGSPSLPPIPYVSDTPDPIRYWCYHCEKRVSVETRENPSDLICLECKNGFVESISAPSPSPPSSPPPLQSPSFNHQFLQILRLVAAAAPAASAATDPPSDTEDFLRIELDGWENDTSASAAAADPSSDYEDDFMDDFSRSITPLDEEEENNEANDENDADPHQRRQRRDLLRFRVRDFTGRGSDLDWAEIIRGLEDHTIELRVQMPGAGSESGYAGNPEDYVDAAGYEALLQNLAEMDGGSRRGAPPAARSVVANLPTVQIEEEGLICAICKESVPVGEKGRKLPCDHVYHLDCIGPWLDSRNSCPVCRFELPTDDPDYEEERKKRRDTMGNNNF